MKVIYIFIFCSLFSYNFSQEILKHSYNCPTRILDIETVDTIMYALTDMGLSVCLEKSNKIEVLQKNVLLSPRNSGFMKINNSKLLVKYGDSLFYFNIGNPSVPVLVQKLTSPVNLQEIFNFSESFVFRFGESEYKIVNVTPDSIKYVFTIPLNYSPLAFSCPYIITYSGTNIEFYKLSQSGQFFNSNNLSTAPRYLTSITANKDYLAYIDYYNSGTPHLPSFATYNVIDIKNPLFPIIRSLSLGSDNLPLPSIRLSDISKKYFSSDTYNASVIVDMSGNFLFNNNKYNTHITDSKYYAFADTLRIINNIYPLSDLYNSFSVLPELNLVISFTNNKINLYKIDSTIPDFLLIDSIFYSGKIYKNDSYIIIRDNTIYKVLTIKNGLFDLKDMFILNDVITGIHYHEDIITSFNSNSFSIYVRNGETLSKIFNSTAYNKVYKSFRKGNSIFIADSVKGIVKFSIGQNNQVTEMWKRYSLGNDYSCAVYDNYLVIKERNKIVLYSISDDTLAPLSLDSFSLDNSYILNNIQLIGDNIFADTKKNINTHLMKLSIKDNLIQYNYSVDLNMDMGRFQCIGDNQKYLVCSHTNMFWIKDTSFIMDINADDVIPKALSLSQNYPNPFNPETIIRYSVPTSGFVTLELFNLLGEKVNVLVNEYKEVGTYNFALDMNRYNLPSGIYIYKLHSDNSIIAKKLVYIK